MDKSFSKILFSWYRENKRDMPWRRTKDPYKIWVSEIILQQTRVEQGWAYYERFISRFPEIRSLATATEQEVLKIWQGLGYYSRARNMHTAAKMMVDKYKGKFPSSYKEIHDLKGIGDYTAAAVASIVFGLPYPVVDGNVLRFFSRYFGVELPVDSVAGKKEILRIAREQIDHRNPGEFNQAIMEFGALQCVPGIPDCLVCPFRKKCHAFEQGIVSELPVKSKKTIQRDRYFNYLVFVSDEKKDDDILWLRKRQENDIWKNFYDFPLIETSSTMKFPQLKKTDEWRNILGKMGAKLIGQSEEYRHMLSHQVIYATFYSIRIPSGKKLPFIRVTRKELEKIPVPRLIDRFLRFFLPLQSNYKGKP